MKRCSNLNFADNIVSLLKWYLAYVTLSATAFLTLRAMLIPSGQKRASVELKKYPRKPKGLLWIVRNKWWKRWSQNSYIIIQNLVINLLYWIYFNKFFCLKSLTSYVINKFRTFRVGVCELVTISAWFITFLKEEFLKFY